MFARCLCLTAIAIITTGCTAASPTAPNSLIQTGAALDTVESQVVPATSNDIPATRLTPKTVVSNTCTFDEGITTCVIVDQVTQTTTHIETSGCVAFNGSEFVPGRRSRTYSDTFLITATTTTYAHGKNGPVYDHTTDVTRTLQSSVLISDVCEAF